jgi:hypothetical protein
MRTGIKGVKKPTDVPPALAVNLLINHSSPTLASIPPHRPIVPVKSSITTDQAVFVEIAITPCAQPIPQEDVSYSIPAWSAAVPTTISGVMTIYELAAFVMLAPKYTTAAMSSAPALAQRGCWNHHCQQQGQDDHGKKTTLVIDMLHKLLLMFVPTVQRLNLFSVLRVCSSTNL